MKKIAILANKYPNKYEPTTNMFIQQLSWQFSDMGLETIVICPMPINLNKNFIKLPYKEITTNENGNDITVYRPKYLSMGQSGNKFQKKRVLFTTKAYELAVDKVLKKMFEKPDYLYSYFLCPTSVAASRLGNKYCIPAFMEYGEALYMGNEKYGNEYLSKELTGLKGVIAVSNQNKNYVVDSGIVKDEITIVYPNCFREERFHPIDMKIARQHFGWNENDFIVGFAGSFDERKGILRLQKAVDKLKGVKFACAGQGELSPTSKNCIWAKPVLHENLSYFYSALNIFVLPTTAEGSCTATAEAIGCGCPIISSDRSFNESLCFDDNSIVIDPLNIDEIAEAIKRVKDDPELEESMRKGSIAHLDDLKQGKRMQHILEFMDSKAGGNEANEN